MTKERKRVNDSKPIVVAEVKNYELKRIINQLKKSFTTKKLIFFSILYSIISFISSALIINQINNYYDFAVKIISFMTPFYAITIGFSVTSIVFVLSNLKSFNNHNKQTMEQVITIIISYIILALITILYFLIEIILGDLFVLSENIRVLLSFIFFALTICLISVNFHLFFLIIKVLYLLSHSMLNENNYRK